MARALLAPKSILLAGIIICASILCAHGMLSVKADISDGMVAFYSFDDVTGSAVADSSGNANGGVLTHGTTIASGRVGNAAYFDGTDDDFDIPHQLVDGQTPELSYSFFVKADVDSSDKQYLLAQASSGTNNNDCFSVSYDNVAHTLKVLTTNNANNPVITAPADLTNWTHITVTNSTITNKSQVYINGVVHTGLAATCPQELGSQFIMGRAPWSGYNQQFKGLLDEVRVYNRVLSSSESYELATSTNTNSLAISNPTSGTIVSGTVNLQAVTGGTPALSSVQYYINGVATGAPLTIAPYTYAWNTLPLLQGDYTVSAVGIDENGNAIPAEVVSVEVDNSPAYKLLRPKSIMQTSAEVVWTTDEPTTGLVTYGTTESYGQQVVGDPELSYYHKVSLSGLQPGTVYNFQVSSTDENDNTSLSANQTFSTITDEVGNEWHVTPDGTAEGDGSIEDPWNLQTAFNHPVSVQPGDTIWLHGGTYDGPFSTDLAGTESAPITVRNYQNERAILDGGDSYYPVVSVNGNYTWFWGLEVINSDPLRTTTEAGSNPASVTRGMGFYVEAPGERFINNIIHDTSQGIGFWTPATDAELYGNVIYYNGWDGPDRGHGHGIYSQNDSGLKSIENNLVFKNFDFGLHIYTQGGTINNFFIDRNSFFSNGMLSASGYAQNMLVGGYTVTNNPIVLNNNVYTPHSYGGGLNIGYEAGCNNATAEGNYLASSTAFTYHSNCPRATFKGNTMFGSVPGGAPTNFPDNSYNTSEPTANYATLNVNRYEPTKAYATVFNWQDLDTVSINANALLEPYDTYAVYDSQNYFGAPIATGTYTGSSLAIPMTSTAIAATVGTTPVAPSHTDKEFGNFIIVKTGQTTPPPEEEPDPEEDPVITPVADNDQVSASSTSSSARSITSARQNSTSASNVAVDPPSGSPSESGGTTDAPGLSTEPLLDNSAPDLRKNQSLVTPARVGIALAVMAGIGVTVAFGRGRLHDFK